MISVAASIISIACADPTARCNMDSLSDQTRMELLVERLDGKALFQRENGEFWELEWPGVTCGEDGHVTEIIWTSEEPLMDDDVVVQPGGSIDLMLLPPHLEGVSITQLSLEGSIITSSLPINLQVLELNENRFAGEFRIEDLPASIRRISLHENKLTGSLNIPSLPASTQHFDACFNLFAGTLDLTQLSASLRNLILSGNRFTGGIDLRNINKAVCLDSIGLECNDIRQETLLIGDLPPELRVIRFDLNAFGKIMHVDGREIKPVRNGLFLKIIK